MLEEPKESRPNGPKRAGVAGESWGRAALAAAVILILSWVGFLLVPDRLMAFLSTRVTPHSRDLLVTAWVAFSFIALCWVFVALQHRQKG